ncbi:MAG: FAD:protein FMN transferase [Acidimicrobiia bacterium]
MGADVHVMVVGDDGPGPAGAIARIRDLESRWSRFLPESELSRLNAAGGSPCVVSVETARAIARAVEAWEVTGGAFDPTVDVGTVGYDRDFTMVSGNTTGLGLPRPAPGCGGVEQIGGRVIRLTPGTAFDLGGIGKGLAADLVADEMLAAGAAGVAVNVGGDVRVAGSPPGESGGWVVGIDLDADHDVTLQVALADGGVATSSRLRRRWNTTEGEQHHLLDPTTGLPAHAGWTTVSIVAREARLAEVLTKAVFLAGPGRVDLPVGATGAALTDDGDVVTFPGFEEYRR